MCVHTYNTWALPLVSTMFKLFDQVSHLIIDLQCKWLSIPKTYTPLMIKLVEGSTVDLKGIQIKG